MRLFKKLLVRFNKFFFVAVLFVAGIISSSFYINLRKPIDVSDAAPGDFKWLTDFYILSQCLSIEHFDKTPGKSYDSNGVAMTGGNYHPVNLFQYGIFCFDMYRHTNDESYKKKCITQFRYFLDSTQYHIKPDGSIAFPYFISWRDLKPPWYSGLAQAEGIMYLIRYYYLTKDVRALEYIKRCYNFMMVSVKDSGTYNALSDTTAWIEEYPNSKSKPQVINGFITSIMGLREYCYMFPNDTEAKKTLARCIKTHKQSVYKYDYGTGILYDLGERQQVGPWYMKFQVVQMKHMYHLYNDIFYHDLEMLWGTYAYNKPVPGMFGCLLTDTNYSVPAINKNNMYEPNIYTSYLLKPDNILSLSTNLNSQLKNYSSLFDGNKANQYAFKTDSVNPTHLAISISLKKNIDVEHFFIGGISDTIDKLDIDFEYKKDSLSKFKSLKIKSTTAEGKTKLFVSKPVTACEIKITFRNMPPKKNLLLSEINFYNNSSTKTPAFSHFESQEHVLSTGKNSFTLKKENINDFVIFYKSAKNSQEMQKATWKIYNGIRKENFDITSTDSYCKFLVVFKNEPGSKAQLIKN